MNYYIADTHFGHTGVLQLSNRPFETIEEHDAYIMDVWNDTVTDKDDIYILGDLLYRNKISEEVYLKKLKGRKHLILGNHDLRFKDINYANRKYFASIEQMTMVKDGQLNVVMCHYPLLEWSGYFRGTYHIYGHIHNNISNPAFGFLKTQERALNAGVDINSFRPVTFQELIINNERFIVNEGR